MRAFHTLRRYAARIVIAASLVTGISLWSATAEAQDTQSIIRDTEVEGFLKSQTRPILEGAGLD
ncbi:MAG TPA: hypothetical protein VLZ84_05325, partial [Asticcacaulis sp.]|nr:hypothetical protein [Asticcacaulis sp.]